MHAALKAVFAASLDRQMRDLRHRAGLQDAHRVLGVGLLCLESCRGCLCALDRVAIGARRAVDGDLVPRAGVHVHPEMRRGFRYQKKPTHNAMTSSIVMKVIRDL